jgi:hypothetical protein
MKTILKWLLPVILLFVGCTAAPTDLPPDTAITSPPMHNTMPPVSPEPAQILPQPDDSALTREGAFVNSTELLIRESFPPQVSLVVRGDLPTSCHRLRIAVSQPDPENKIAVDVYSVVDSKQACIQVLKPFEESIDLGTYPNGKYTVWVNGSKAGEFDT